MEWARRCIDAALPYALYVAIRLFALLVRFHHTVSHGKWLRYAQFDLEEMVEDAYGEAGYHNDSEINKKKWRDRPKENDNETAQNLPTYWNEEDLGSFEVFRAFSLLVADLHQCGLHALGRIFTRAAVMQSLAARIRMHRGLRSPKWRAILSNAERVQSLRRLVDGRGAAPLVVCGMPRAGTTLLSRLLALDANAYAPRFFQLCDPWPPTARVDDGGEPRARRAALMTRLQALLLPNLAKSHESLPLEHEECLFALRMEGVFPALCYALRLPAYGAWLMDESRGGHAYASYKRTLRVLCAPQPAAKTHVVLKCPQHSMALDHLHAQFPNARVVLCARRPADVLCSCVQLAQAIREGLVEARVRDDMPALGAWSLRMLRRAMQHAVTHAGAFDAAASGGAALCDYGALVAEPVATVRRLYAHFGMPFSDAFAARLAAYVARNPRHRLGKPRQVTLAELGLAEAEVAAAFDEALRLFPRDASCRQ